VLFQRAAGQAEESGGFGVRMYGGGKPAFGSDIRKTPQSRGAPARATIAFARVYHDIGMWTDRELAYLEP
jgi:hypothetical protein